jgi:hypothetical protein
MDNRGLPPKTSNFYCLPGRAGGTPMGISRRRTTPDGTFDGTVHIAVAVSYFTEFWTKAISHKDGAMVGLIRTDGEVLARLPGTCQRL